MPAKKATATKNKTSTAKKTVKKTTAKSQAATKPKKVTNKKQPSQQSFRKCPEAQPFMTFKITSQTVYWLIIALPLVLKVEKYQFNRKIWYVTLIMMAILTSFTPVGIMI